MKIEEIISSIPEDEKTSTVLLLLEVIYELRKDNKELRAEVSRLKDEIARLKGNPPRPKLKPSTTSDINKSEVRKASRRKPKGRTAKNLEVHETKRISWSKIPKASEFVFEESIIVQDIIIRPVNTKFIREVRKTSDGKLIRPPWPKYVQGEFGPNLKAYILSLYFDSHMTQPSILNHLKDIGSPVSSGQISNILIEDKDLFHTEKERILETSLSNSVSLTADDTGLRHKGKNGYCTHIGNEFFAYFKSTGSKSRINFLEILRGKDSGYSINGHSLAYYKNQKLSEYKFSLLKRAKGKQFKDKSEWESFLKFLGIRDEHHIRKATEGALIGRLMTLDINPALIIVSDDAGQFDVFRHALCWVHAERAITSINTSSYEEDQIIKGVLEGFWDLFRSLHEYKRSPSSDRRKKISLDFDKLFLTKKDIESIDKALASILQKKKELLMVLEEPSIPLTNNASEKDIRDQAKKRKISAGTYSDAGRNARDTFMSLQKTCKKLGIPFAKYLYDRLSGANEIPGLDLIIREKINASIRAAPC